MPSALTQVDTRELSLVDRGAVMRRFAMRKRDGADAMNDVAIKVLKAELEPELLAKFEAKLNELAKDAGTGAMDPGLKSALKGMLQLMASFKDKLQTPQLQALAHLVGFTGNLMNGDAPDASAASDDSDDADDADAGDDDGASDLPPDGDPPLPDDSVDPSKDPTGKDGQTPPTDPNKDKPTSSNPFGKKDATVNKAFEAFKKKADAEAAALRKGQEELRKQNEEIRAELRKKEVSALVAKDYKNLGSNAVVTEMLLGLEKQGLLKGMEQNLRAWNNQLATSEVFKEMGADGDREDATPEEQLNKKASELRKADPSMSQGVAYTKAWDSNPELAAAVKARDAARRQA